MPPAIFIYTALPAEAKPLIGRFRLKKELDVRAFAIFRRDNVCLTVTGIGKSAMAAGVAYSQALFGGAPYPVMLNAGIAGHRRHPLGSLFLSNKITDADSQKCHYPPVLFRPPCQVASILTYSRPQLAYGHEELCDMEASAFYEAANRFSTGELIHTLKVVSDNESHPAGQVTASTASELLATHLDAILQVLAQLSQLSASLDTPEPHDFRALLGHYHFTANGQLQLKDKLARWELLGLSPVFESLPELANGKAVLRWLDEMLAGVAFYL